MDKFSFESLGLLESHFKLNTNFKPEAETSSTIRGDDGTEPTALASPLVHRD